MVLLAPAAELLCGCDDSAPSDGFGSSGANSAARISSGLGTFRMSAELDGTCSVLPVLICRVPGLNPGLVGTVALSSARSGPAASGATTRPAASAVANKR